MTTEPGDEAAEASWQSDPYGRNDRRYWDGRSWTSKVRVEGVRGIDPPGVDPNPSGAPLHRPAPPIRDAHLPLNLTASKVPVAMALAFVVMAGIVVLLAYGAYALVAG